MGVIYWRHIMAKIFQASFFLNVLKHYHKRFPEDPPNVLVSLAYNMNEWKLFLEKYRHMIGVLYGDSGAWSSDQGTSDISLEDVIFFFSRYGPLMDLYFNFDSNFSEQGFEDNIANQLKMERAELCPVPVIHNFFSKEIEYYITSGKYDWLALGSSQSSNFDDFRYAVDKIKGLNPDIKIHWFGGSKYTWMIKVPVASCDTTSWAKSGSFGKINFYNRQKGKSDLIYVGGQLKKFKKGEYHFVTYPWRKDVEEYLYQTFKLTYRDLLGYDDKVNMQLVNARFFVEMEKRINQERIRRGIPLE